MAIITSMADHLLMTPSVQHQPRVVWDGARAFVRAALSPGFLDFSWRVRDLLGQEIHAELAASHDRLVAADIRTGGDRSAGDLEAARWRVRLEGLLRERPELTHAVVELTARGFES
jgi:hypothetical protein